MRYFIGALVAIGLLILVLALIFHGGGAPIQKKVVLTDYATATSGVRLTIDGPISATQTHYDAVITITQDKASLYIIQGYENDVTDSRSYPMNPNAYAVFLHALNLAGYTKGNADKALADERGFCSTGERYIFELRDGEKQIERFWSTSCGGGTFKGNSPLVRTLFQKQIPDYNELAGHVGL
jgi:hypothetical protein